MAAGRVITAGAGLLAACALAAITSACGADRGADELLLATTSSAYDTGLLDRLGAEYRAAGYRGRIRPLVVGTGEALELGRRGDADVLIVHSVADELRFMEAGHGVLRIPIFENDFAIVGPAADPAGVTGAADAIDAARRIAAAAAPFISRGDDSGTHRAERALWLAARIPPNWAGYTEAGLGMAETLRVADERGAYALSDLATFRTFEHTLDLIVTFEGDERLANPYSVIVVAGARNEQGARAFAGWLAGHAAAAVIAQHDVDRFGSPLFWPIVRPSP